MILVRFYQGSLELYNSRVVSKVVAALPITLTADTLYVVRVGDDLTYIALT